VVAPQDHPRIVGRYALYDELAAGGMATVHLGRLLGPVGFSRTVAIKRLHPQFARDAEFVAMFLDEARLAARIHHPNVVQTLDVVAASGELFLVMDYVAGETLSRLWKLTNHNGLRIRPRIATSILCSALHGLHAAHEATSDRGESLGIVHRDVSPQNILVGVDGVARVLDFGVAKAIGRAHTTRDGRLKGKLAYMAPEQLQGKATRRTDLFAASVVLWEALTGERLFAGEDEQEVVGNVLSKVIPPPSAYLGRDAETAITPEQLQLLDDVTLRGLARAPGQRFETAREMALALEHCLGIASPTEMGAWVESTAGQLLGERAQRVAEIESHSSFAGPSSRAPVTESQGVDAVGGDANGPNARGNEQTRSQLSTASVSKAALPEAGAPAVLASRRIATVGIALGGLLLVGGAGVALRRRGPDPARPGLGPQQEVEPPPPSASVEPSASPPPTGSTATTSEIEAGAPMQPQSRVAHPSRRPPRNATAPSADLGKGPSPNCDPSFTLDDQGRKHFKPECYLKKAP
jgi:serine/threonine-protein kinase